MSTHKKCYSIHPAFTCSILTVCEICSKLTKKTPERCHRSGVFIVNFEHISHFVLVFLLLTLNMYLLTGNSLIQLQNHYKGLEKMLMEKMPCGGLTKRFNIVWKSLSYLLFQSQQRK